MIILKTEDDVRKIREAGEILIYILCYLKTHFMISGVSVKDIDAEVIKLAERNNAKPAFLGYRGYPASICVSINDVVIHGIPDDTVLKDGDIVSLDLGIEKDGFFADAARTFFVGNIDKEKKRLIEITRKALFIAIDAINKENRIFDISKSIQDWVLRNNYNVVKEFTGHGVGLHLHEEPQIPNFVPNNGIPNPTIRKGMVIAIEPMVTMGKGDVVVEKDGWTVRTKDHSLSAHFEDTIYVKEDGVEILTKGCYV